MANLTPGNSLGKFDLVREIGRGGMGVVYLAIDTRLDREVALKVLSRSFVHDEQFLADLESEARSIAKIAHPGVVHLHSFEEIDGLPVLEMEYVSGGSLAALRASHRFSPAEALAILCDLAETLAYCHERRLVHRDVKPGNVLIDDHGRARLTDFGLAKAVSNATHTTISQNASGLFVGTARYAPPEAWEGAEATAAWDVYSLGALAYELFTGTPLYAADSPFALLKHMFDRPKSDWANQLSNLSPELAGAIESMLAWNPNDRPQDGGGALRLLERVPEFESLGKVRPPRIQPDPATLPAKPSPEPEQRRLALWMPIAAVVLLLIAGFGYLLARDFGSGAPNEAPATAAATDAAAFTFDLFASDTGEALDGSSILIARDGATEPVLVVRTAGGIWYLDVAEEDAGLISLTGHWAEYADRRGSMLRYGAVRGAGRWIEPDEMFIAQFTFTSEQSGAEWERGIEAKRSPGTTRQGFWFGFADSRWHLPLLYNELLPRGFDWAAFVASELSSYSGPQVSVPWVASRDEVVVDGQLTEEFWQPVPQPRVGHRGAAPGDGDGQAAELLARACPEGVLLAVRVNSAIPAPVVDVGVLPRFACPVSLSEYWLATWQASDWSHATHYQPPEERTWDASWPAGLAITDGATVFEMLIPWESVRFADATGETTRWHLNMQVRTAPDETPAELWGAPEVSDLAHGLVLVFEEKQQPATAMAE